MFNAAALQVMLDKGLTLADVIEIAAANEKRSDPTNADRQARYRETKRNALRNGVTPPKEEIKTPSSVPDGTVVEADPVKNLIDMGVSMLMSQGFDERKARSLVGSWRKGRQTGEVVAALVDAKTRSIGNLVEWMPKRLSATEPPSYLETYRSERQAVGGHQ